MITVDFDTSDFDRAMDKFSGDLDMLEKQILGEMADTLLLISRNEVPFRDGDLSKSGHTDWEEAERAYIVAYNTEYASYVHEGMRKDGTHVIRHYGQGRKKKYLEDPLKMNLSLWSEIARKQLASYIG